MARFDPATDLLTIFPRMRSGVSFQNQFSQVSQLQVYARSLGRWDLENPITENALNQGLELVGLPDGFGKVFQYGLGLKRPYRGLIHNIEDHSNCTIVRFSDSGPEGPDSGVFNMTLQRFGNYKQAIDRNRDRGARVVRRVNAAEAHNATAGLLDLPPEVPTIGRHPVIQAMTREITEQPVLDTAERRMLVRQTSKEARIAATEAPAEFGQLRQDIELVSLEVLIEQFEKAMTGSCAKDEAYWQRFFEINTFALQQLFAVPVVLYKSQLTVKGVNAFGKGSRIADFMLVSTVTRSALVVEIKTPAARLTGKRYRGSGGAEVFLPHKDLLGAVTQIQAQIESAQVHLPTLLGQTPDAQTLDTSVVRGAVIVGTAGTLGAEEQASYLRYRAGLGNVEVIAFDEVRDRLKALRQLLAMEATATN